MYLHESRCYQKGKHYFQSLFFISREQIKGNATGKLNVGAVNAGLKASLDKLSAECNDISDIAINYYATDLPDKLPTTMEDLVSVIENFPSRLKKLNDGKGIPMKVRFSPENLHNTHNVIQDVYRFFLQFIYYSSLKISKYYAEKVILPTVALLKYYFHKTWTK